MRSLKREEERIRDNYTRRRRRRRRRRRKKMKELLVG